MTTMTTQDMPVRVGRRLEDLEEQVVALLRRYTPLLLRLALAVTFVWFGALKIAGVPTLPAALIAAIFPFVAASWFVPLVGAVEVVLGLALLSGWRTRWVLAALTGHLAGTLLVLVLRPDVAFQGGNPLLLSVEGEYVVKNLVLMAGALMLATHLPAPLRRGPRPS